MGYLIGVAVENVEPVTLRTYPDGIRHPVGYYAVEFIGGNLAVAGLGRPEAVAVLGNPHYIIIGKSGIRSEPYDTGFARETRDRQQNQNQQNFINFHGIYEIGGERLARKPRQSIVQN